MHETKNRSALLVGLALAVSVFVTGAASAKCGQVSIGAMNWDSARVIANIEKLVLQAGFDCQVEIIETSTVPGVTSQVEKGTPDILSETWVKSVKALYDKGIEQGRIVRAGAVLLDGGLESWWIPAYLRTRHPTLETVEDLKRNWRLFATPDNPGKGRFYSCPDGWGCQIINANMFKAYGLADTFELYEPKSADDLKRSIAQAYAQRRPWVGYYWAPTAILGRYPMVELKLAAASPTGHACNQRADCAAPHAGRYPPSLVVSTTTAKFKETNPREFAFISQIAIRNRIMNGILAWGEKNQASAPEMARHFLQAHIPLWKSWLPPDIAEKVEAGL